MRRFYWTQGEGGLFFQKQKLNFENEARERSVKISGESHQKK